MVDEGMSVQVAVSFITQFHYAFYPSLSPHFGSFEPGMSIGLLSTFPGGVGWLFGGSLFFSRLFHGFYFLGLLFLLGLSVVYTFRVYEQKARLTFFSLIFISGYLSLKFIPTLTDNIIYGMGEYSGSMLWLCATLLALRHPFISSFFLGCVLFHTKFIFLPYCGLSFLFLVFWHKMDFKKITQSLLLFLLPLFLWVSLIYLRTGSEGLDLWLQGRGFHISYAKTGTGSHLSETLETHMPVAPRLSISERLESPVLEWTRYSLSIQLKIIFLLLLGVVSTVFSFFYFFRQKAFVPPSKSPLILSFFFLGLAFVFLIFTSWYFVLHSEMWLRHILPTLFISYCVGAFVLFIFYFKFGKNLLDKNTKKLKFILPVMLLFFTGLGLRDFKNVWTQFHLFQKNSPEAVVYSQLCQREKGHSLKEGPADQPLEKCGFNFPLDVNLGQKNLRMRY